MSKYLSNKGFKIVEGIIWTMAVEGITKEVREYKTIIRK